MYKSKFLKVKYKGKRLFLTCVGSFTFDGLTNVSLVASSDFQPDWIENELRYFISSCSP